MPTMTDVLNNARSKLGVVESPPNSNNQMFGIWYGFNRVPWCAIFVSWCMAHSGVGNQYRHASVAFSLDAARKQGRRTGEFRAGFVACRYLQSGDVGTRAYRYWLRLFTPMELLLASRGTPLPVLLVHSVTEVA